MPTPGLCLEETWGDFVEKTARLARAGEGMETLSLDGGLNMADAGRSPGVINNEGNGEQRGEPESQHPKRKLRPGQNEKESRSREAKAKDPVPN